MMMEGVESVREKSERDKEGERNIAQIIVGRYKGCPSQGVIYLRW